MESIYTPTLGLKIAVSGRERKQSRFKGSSEGAERSIEGARKSTMRQCRDAADDSLIWIL